MNHVESTLLYLFIINPISGTAKKHNIAEMIRRSLKIDQHRIEIVYTQYAGHARELAAEAVQQGVPNVISVGGDGTMHDVVNALHINNRLDIPILLFPAGSGNAFNHDFDSLTYQKASDRLRQFRTMSIDLMKIEMIENHIDQDIIDKIIKTVIVKDTLLTT